MKFINVHSLYNCNIEWRWRVGVGVGERKVIERR